uniref:Amino acid transporter transmembrane domain-containing protein n=1 Tax=Chromera velia CCMP2878 TaxID=1169474 RepID=A0A0G4I8K3_9ALVE|mmetsp:Transcript_6273/g.12403  ORF Transcript_6273/g.12403 Transcript_6273/m.12403 type:complete len:480 (-) Transcript_6273:326-1765(-)|eukprot:Cvel_11966.t1-p1 / transcript=Cvel_11966.t1 / gene=Cvel_11966 / organism=Chromera_velia_CCMP2878 / gene_product=Vacuolar amino acid transporter 5, putative / transcript_product=Vacuolar amino acid transporter 5, putative / location=Cvel_scaffold767:5197-10620(+) / protein_length=479 / sequence_SO=supercontig / SO=protein_coding / is_pseudo=false
MSNPANTRSVSVEGAEAQQKEKGKETPKKLKRVWSERTFSTVGPGSIRGSIITLVGAALGVGSLTLPYAMSLVGIHQGIVMLFLSGGASFISLSILKKATARTDAHDYAELLYRTTGSKRASLGIDMIICVFCFGSLCTFFIFFGDFCPAVVQPLPLPEFMKERGFVLVFFALAVMPLTQLDKISMFRGLASLPVVASLLFTGCMGFFARENFQRAVESGLELFFFRLDVLMTLKANSIFLFAFFQHISAVFVAYELVSPSDLRVEKTVGRAIWTEIAIYIPLAVFGYLSFLSSTEGNVSRNYPMDSIPFLVCRLLFCLALMVCVPLRSYAAANSAVSLAWKWGILPGSPAPSVGTTGAMRGGDEERALVGVTPGEEEEQRKRAMSRGRRSLGPLFLLGALMVGLRVRQVAEVVALLSALLATTIMISGPLGIFLCSLRNGTAGVGTGVAVFVVVYLSVFALLGYTQALVTVAQGFGWL